MPNQIFLKVLILIGAIRAIQSKIATLLLDKEIPVDNSVEWLISSCLEASFHATQTVGYNAISLKNLTVNGLKPNAPTVSLFADLFMFSSASQTLALRFTIRYENFSDYSECRLTLYSGNVAFLALAVILLHDHTQVKPFQALDVVFKGSYGHYCHKILDVKTSTPVEYMLNVHPNNSYAVWVDRKMIIEHYLSDLFETKNENFGRSIPAVEAVHRSTNITKLEVFLLNNNNEYHTIVDDIQVSTSPTNNSKR